MFNEKYPFYTCDSTTWLVGSIYAGYWNNKKHTGIGKKFLIKNKKLDIIKTVQSENTYDINLRWVKGMNNMQNYITKLWKYKGVAKVNEKKMAEAEWSATIVDRKK